MQSAKTATIQHARIGIHRQSVADNGISTVLVIVNDTVPKIGSCVAQETLTLRLKALEAES